VRPIAQVLEIWKIQQQPCDDVRPIAQVLEIQIWKIQQQPCDDVRPTAQAIGALGLLAALLAALICLKNMKSKSKVRY
jgi:hypothetical protein